MAASSASSRGPNPGVRSGNASGGGLGAQLARAGVGAGSSRRRSASQIRRSGLGGARLGCAGSTDSASRPMCTRSRSMTAGVSMLAMTRSRPPHCRQVSPGTSLCPALRAAFGRANRQSCRFVDIDGKKPLASEAQLVQAGREHAALPRQARGEIEEPRIAVAQLKEALAETGVMRRAAVGRALC